LVADLRSDLSDFLRPWAEGRTLQDDDDLFDRLGVEGDDAFEFMEAFAARFGVDVSGYCWYFTTARKAWAWAA
jgi:hypothetical protein